MGAVLERIESENPKLNVFVIVLPERALEEAARVEKEILAGEDRGSLHVIPIGLKNIIYTQGVRTTMDSAFFEDFFPEYDSTVVQKSKEAGAVIVGKTNTHEFA